MDKLEYIPGDLAFHYIPKTIIKKYVKVYVCSTQNALSLEDMDGNLYDYIGELYPIPLTPEILEKNGWKRDGKWYCLSTKRAYLYTIQDTGQPDEFLICAGEGKHNLTSVSFVHQLQHFLFGLNLNSEMEV